MHRPQEREGQLIISAVLWLSFLWELCVVHECVKSLSCSSVLIGNNNRPVHCARYIQSSDSQVIRTNDRYSVISERKSLV